MKRNSWFFKKLTRSVICSALFVLPGTVFAVAISSTTYYISTIAGSGTGGFLGDSGSATSARLYNPFGVAVDSAGSVYIADVNNYRIRKVNASGIISTIAGNGTAGYAGDATSATSASTEINNPYGVAVDSAGNVYIADTYNNRIRKINTSGIISTIAGNGTAGYSGDGTPATSYELYNPYGVAVDSAGNVYIADTNNNRIRKVSTSGAISTIAGNGTAIYSGEGGLASMAGINNPYGVAVDSAGNVYIADTNNNRIRKVNNTSGIISTIAGNGTAGYSGDGTPPTSYELYNPCGVAVDSSGNVYIADRYNSRIRKVSASNNTLTTIAGNGTASYLGDGALAASAELYYPSGISVDSSGNVYIGDYYNYRIRKLSAATNTVPTLSWTGEANYTSDGLNPSTGDTTTTFTFRVMYTDSNNDAPKAGYPKLHIYNTFGEISGSPFAMTAVTTGTYTSGVIYSSTMTLSAGTYSSLYEAYDVYSNIATGLPTSALSGPSVTAAGAVAGTVNFNWDYSSTAIPSSRDLLCAGVINDIVYLASGWNGQSIVPILESASPLSNSTSSGLPSMNTPRMRATSAVVNNSLYVIGGMNNNTVIGSVEVYSPGNSWVTKTSIMPSPSWSSAAVAYNSKIYVIGGLNSSQTMNNLQVYDPTNDQWTSAAGMPTSRSSLAAAVVNNKIYAIGGRNISGVAINTVEMYDPTIGTWTTKSSMPTARSSAGVVVIGGKIYVIGGDNGTACVTNVEEYNPATDTWTAKTSLTTAWAYGSAVTVGGSVYLMCGISSYNTSANTIVLTTSAFKGSMTAPVLSWVNLPGYYTKGVSPDTGQSGSTEFAFEVSYANATAYQPATGYPKLHIIQNGLDIISSPFIMNLQNGNVSSGQTYSYTTTLPDGSYSYYFEAMDSQNNLAVGDPLTINSGPVASSVLPASVSSELINNVHAYPIPALIGKGEKISFTALPPNATVTIMAPDGHILKKLHPGTGGIIAPWDGRTDDGNFLASGVYIVHARDSFGNKKIFSIAIVR